MNVDLAERIFSRHCSRDKVSDGFRGRPYIESHLEPSFGS